MTAIEPQHDNERVLEQLGLYLDYETSDRETEEIVEHIASCELCQRRLLELRGVEQVYTRRELQTEPPPDYRERVMARLWADLRSSVVP